MNLLTKITLIFTCVIAPTLSQADVVRHSFEGDGFGSLNLTFSTQVFGNSGPASLVSWDYLCGIDFTCSGAQNFTYEAADRPTGGYISYDANYNMDGTAVMNIIPGTILGNSSSFYISTLSFEYIILPDMFSLDVTMSDSSVSTYNLYQIPYVPLSQAPVPLPPALWMFCAGLLGLFKLSRNRRT